MLTQMDARSAISCKVASGANPVRVSVERNGSEASSGKYSPAPKSTFGMADQFAAAMPVASKVTGWPRHTVVSARLAPLKRGVVLTNTRRSTLFVLAQSLSSVRYNCSRTH